VIKDYERRNYIQAETIYNYKLKDEKDILVRVLAVARD
jgi:hypothetical protein